MLYAHVIVHALMESKLINVLVSFDSESTHLYYCFSLCVVPKRFDRSETLVYFDHFKFKSRTKLEFSLRITRYHLHRSPFTFDSLVNLPQLSSELVNLQFKNHFTPMC